MIYDDGIVDAKVPYFKDGTRVELVSEETGTVRHDMGGVNVPVYLDGVNTSGYPHDYTSVPRDSIARSRFELDDEDDDEDDED